jgi:OPA family glycerol-3-phosphate transporter-like MFS transporter 1/2
MSFEGSMLTDTPEEQRVGWSPFNAVNGQSLLGQVDLAFLGTYALGMFFAGHLGDRVDLRYFLTAGMFGSGLFTILFGLGFFYNIHAYSYFIFVSVLAGLFQSTGWPSVVSIVANWFGKGKRGLIMGIWNAHTSIGNILGTVVAASLLSSGWGWSFVVPGLLMMFLGVVIFFFLVVQPSDVGLPSPYEQARGYELVREEDELDSKQAALAKKEGESEGIRFIDAWRIPGVSAFAFCLFFSKLIAYTFLYWLPYYINSTPIEGGLLTPKEAGDLSILFDIGGVAGGVMAGHLSDKTGASALVATSFTILSVPFLWMYRKYGHVSFSINIALMMLSGFCVNGPYALITTAVSADLGTHESLHGNSKALATVTAIIDGMGSIGAAIGPMMTGYISEVGGFDLVFVMLYLSALMAGLLLIKLAAKDYAMLRGRK